MAPMVEVARIVTATLQNNLALAFELPELERVMYAAAPPKATSTNESKNETTNPTSTPIGNAGEPCGCGLFTVGVYKSIP